MKTNLFKAVTMFAIGLATFTSCEKAELVSPQAPQSSVSTDKRRSIGSGDAIDVDPEIAPEPENPRIKGGKTIPIHVGNEAIQDLQEAAPAEPIIGNGGENHENGRR